MTAAAGELLERLNELGASVVSDGDRLVIRAGASGLPAALMVRLRAAKSEVIAALASGTRAPSQAVDGTTHSVDAAWWRDHFLIRTIHRELSGKRARSEAQQIAFNDLIDEWRERYGRRCPVWQCAGCEAPLGGLSALTLADGNRVHFGEENECLIRFGRRWRGDAIGGLRALGLEPPPDIVPP